MMDTQCTTKFIVFHDENGKHMLEDLIGLYDKSTNIFYEHDVDFRYLLSRVSHITANKDKEWLKESETMSGLDIKIYITKEAFVLTIMSDPKTAELLFYRLQHFYNLKLIALTAPKDYSYIHYRSKIEGLVDRDLVIERPDKKHAYKIIKHLNRIRNVVSISNRYKNLSPILARQIKKFKAIIERDPIEFFVEFKCKHRGSIVEVLIEGNKIFGSSITYLSDIEMAANLNHLGTAEEI